MAVALPASATEVKTTQFESRCAGWDLMKSTLVRFQELPMMTMNSVRKINGQPTDLETVLFANVRTGTWTLVEQLGPDSFCITGMGDAIRPFDPNARTS
jgi:hypothetical protein